MELDGGDLHVPEVCMEDFEHAMVRSRGSVAGRELKKYEDWTAEFGSEGS